MGQPQYDSIAHEVNDEWQDLWKSVGSGERSSLSAMKNHYTRLIEASPEAAAETLAMQERRIRTLLAKDGTS